MYGHKEQIITTQFDTECIFCGEDIKAGEKIRWRGSSYRVAHEKCGRGMALPKKIRRVY